MASRPHAVQQQQCDTTSAQCDTVHISKVQHVTDTKAKENFLAGDT